MTKILQKYRILINRAKDYVINAFAASDLDGNGMCNLDEFTLLNRHIESEKFDAERIEKIFMENADLFIEGEKNLSFDQFSVVCVEFNLFSDEQQNNYLSIEDKSELDSLWINLKIKWNEEMKEKISNRFKSLNIISQEEIDKWFEIIDVLDEKIRNENVKNVKPFLIAYNILDKESEAFCDAQENDFEDNTDDET